MMIHLMIKVSSFPAVKTDATFKAFHWQEMQAAKLRFWGKRVALINRIEGKSSITNTLVKLENKYFWTW